jgi:hypothetical protein
MPALFPLERKTRAVADRDRTAVRLHDRQAEAGARDRLLGGSGSTKEALEQTLLS